MLTIIEQTTNRSIKQTSKHRNKERNKQTKQTKPPLSTTGILQFVWPVAVALLQFVYSVNVCSFLQLLLLFTCLITLLNPQKTHRFVSCPSTWPANGTCMLSIWNMYVERWASGTWTLSISSRNNLSAFVHLWLTTCFWDSQKQINKARKKINRQISWSANNIPKRSKVSRSAAIKVYCMSPKVYLHSNLNLLFFLVSIVLFLQ